MVGLGGEGGAGEADDGEKKEGRGGERSDGGHHSGGGGSRRRWSEVAGRRRLGKKGGIFMEACLLDFAPRTLWFCEKGAYFCCISFLPSFFLFFRYYGKVAARKVNNLRPIDEWA